MRRAVQYFDKDYLSQTKKLTPSQIVDFITQYQSVFFSYEGKKKLISIRIPEELLKVFRRQTDLIGKAYQTQIVNLMREWVLLNSLTSESNNPQQFFVQKIISGGQTGVDRAALDVAMRFGISCGGWCPKNRIAEDGQIPQQYPLLETPTEDFIIRTEWNVRDSDGTLVILWDSIPNGGTGFTVECIKKWGKSHFIANLSEEPNIKIQTILVWIKTERIKILNIAGPRASYRRDVYLEAYKLITNLVVAGKKQIS